MALGEPDVDRMLRRMPARVFARLMWAEQVEPFGELRMDYGFAQIVAMIHNTSVAENHQKPVEAFLLKFVAEEERKPQGQAVEDQIRILNIIGMAMAVPGKDA